MSKKTLYIVIGVILVIGLLIGWYFLTRDTLPDTTRNIPVNDNPLPFGSDLSLDDITPSDTDTNDPLSSLFDGPLPVLRQITEEPVAGATTYSSEGIESVRYIERATGHVFDGSLSDTLVTRVSNTTIAGIHDAAWAENGTSVIARFLKDSTIQTFTGALTEIDPATASEEFTSNTTIEQELQGSFLPDNITAVTSSPDGSKIFYILPTTEGAFGIVSNPDGGNKKTVFSSPLSEWHASWDTPNFVTLSSNPTNGVVGLAYTLDTRNNNLVRILTNIAGLTASMSFDGKKILYSESARASELNLKVRTRSDASILSTGLHTLPEKCTWSKLQTEIVYCAAPATLPSGTYPDSWYLGLMSFNDALWKIDTTTGAIDIVSVLKQQAGQEIDAIQLLLNNEETHLFFINKKDSSLWSLELTS